VAVRSPKALSGENDALIWQLAPFATVEEQEGLPGTSVKSAGSAPVIETVGVTVDPVLFENVKVTGLSPLVLPIDVLAKAWVDGASPPPLNW
jgi:hypothetical protein